MSHLPQAFSLAQINHWISLSVAFARTAGNLNEVPIGAVVIKDGQMISGGYNTKESHNDPTGHAEIVALRNAASRLGTWRLDDCILVSTMEPCPMCAGALIQSRIKAVAYGAVDLRWGAAGTITNVFSTPYNHSVDLIHVPNEACIDIVKGFFLRNRQCR